MEIYLLFSRNKNVKSDPAWSHDCSASQLLLFLLCPELRLSSGSHQRCSEGRLCPESQTSESFARRVHGSLPQHPCSPGCTGTTHAHVQSVHCSDTQQSQLRPKLIHKETTSSLMKILKKSLRTLSVLQLVQSLHVLSNHIIFYNLSTPEQILNLFPESFHSSLKNLITKILLENWWVWTIIKPVRRSDGTSYSKTLVELRNSLNKSYLYRKPMWYITIFLSLFIQQNVCNVFFSPTWRTEALNNQSE